MALLAAGAGNAQPANLGKLDTALKWIPADAAFYSASLRMGEQFEAIAKSRAWAKLKALPAVQAVWQMLQHELTQPEGKLAELTKLYEQPENRQLVELLGDLFAQECFIYGGASSSDFMGLLMEINAGARFGPLFAQLSGEGGVQRPLAQAKAVADAFADNLELIKFPDLVLGFKLRDTRRAEAQLKRLEALLQALVQQAPPLKGRLKRVQVAGGDYLTLTLDGSMVPWDQIPLQDLADKPGQYDALLKKLRELRLVVSLGLRENYLLLALGESTDSLASLGRGPLLADRPEFKPLARFVDRRLTSIGYASKNLLAQVVLSPKDVDDGVKVIKEDLLKQVELTEPQRARIDQDLRQLAADLKTFISDPGPAVSFSFLTSRGQESYQYLHGRHPSVDGSKPLPLLQHVGGNPLLAVVGRSRYSPETYPLLVKWIKVANRYFEEFGVPKFDAAEKEKYEQAAKVLHPLLRRLDEVTGKMLLPALADGQAGFVLDAKVTSQQWIQFLPPTEKPLPMLEPACILGVSDAALLQKACGEYRQILNEMIAKIRELSENQFPEFQIPPPQTEKLKRGVLYAYPLPEAWGVDRQILPNSGVAPNVAVLALSRAQTERLLTPTPLKISGGPLADPKRPLAAASYVDCAGILDALAPWIDLGTTTAAPFLTAMAGEQAKAVEDLPGQVRTVLEVLKVFRSYSSATYVEDGALVTHGETVIRDL
jgi:hypothetical protein